MDDKDKSDELAETGKSSHEMNSGPTGSSPENPDSMSKEDLARLQADLKEAQSQVQRCKKDNEYVEREIEEIVQILRSIKGSAGWKLISRIRRAKARFLPLGTRRRRIYDKFLSNVRKLPLDDDIQPPNRRPIRTSENVESDPRDDYFQVRLVLRDAPVRLESGKFGLFKVEVTNLSPHNWIGNVQGKDQRGFVSLSYHWLDESGKLVHWDGERSNLPRDLEPSGSTTVEMKVYAPFSTGVHTIQIAPVCEGVAWFDEKGSAPACSTVQIEGEQRSHSHRPSCSIVIPVFNCASLTKSCLLGIERSLSGKGIPHEIIVVDNGSTDSTPELLKAWSDLRCHARVISLCQNWGYSRACNEGARMARGEYLVLLNNDTLPTPGWLENLIDLAERDPKTGIVGSKLLYPDGKIQHIGVAFSGNMTPRHIYRGFLPTIPPAKLSREYQAVTGACLLMKKELFWKVGGLDEIFRNLYEDMDLCMKVRAEGYRVLVCADSLVYHFEGMSQGPRVHDYRNAARFKARWDGHVEMDLNRWHETDHLSEEMTEFEPSEDLRARPDRWIKALWRQIYSSDVPEL